jgi:hypothetical protein
MELMVLKGIKGIELKVLNRIKGIELNWYINADLDLLQIWSKLSFR